MGLKIWVGQKSFYRYEGRFYWLNIGKHFGLNTNLAHVSKLGEEGLVVYNYLFTSQREPHFVPDRDFFATLLLISSHFELLRIELPKLTLSILMEIVTILVVLVDEFYFYMNQPIKPWLFEKIIFCASSSLHFHMDLKSLVSY